MNNSGKSEAAPHAFPGRAGELADLMAESARLLRRTTAENPAADAWKPLWHKRFSAALALARHDEQRAESALRRLCDDVAEAVERR